MNKTVGTSVFLICVLASGMVLADQNGHMKFVNELPHEIVVDILHSDGRPQKGNTIKAGKGNSFKFGAGGACKDKSRLYTVKKTDGTILASGGFTVVGETYVAARGGGSTECAMRPEKNPTTEPQTGFTLTYKKPKTNRGEFTIGKE
ncbi:MAG: hypothetical protein L3J24_07885 [Xanthomonadales bacterium]|nr:hypothetical protein [Xanthomonadales bacterium]